MLTYVQFVDNQNPHALSQQGCFPATQIVACTGILGCYPRCRTLHLPFLNFTLFSLAHSSSLSQSFCQMMCPGLSDVSTSLPSILSSEDMVRVLPILSSRIFMKMLNSIGPSINLGGTPLVTGCQPEQKSLIATVSYPSRRPPIESVSCQFVKEEAVVDNIECFAEVPDHVYSLSQIMYK